MHITKRLCVAALAALALAACDSPEERLQKHFERGLSLVEAGSSDKARLEFRNALKIDRDHAPSRFQLGLLAETGGDLRGAGGHYRAVADADATHVEARVKLAQLYLLGGAVDDARASAEEAYELAPENVSVLNTRAAIRYRLGDLREARATAEAALRLDPDAVPAHLLLLSMALSEGGPDVVDPDLDALLARFPQDQSLHLFKLRVAQERNDAGAVIAQLETMIELFPEDLSLRQALAQVYFRLGDIGAVEAQLRAIAERRPDDPDAALNVVRLVAERDGPAGAEAELRRLIAAAPGGDAAAPFREALSALLIVEGREAEARATLEEAVAAAETPAVADDARVRQARLAMAAGETARGEALISEILERDGDNVEALALRAALAIDRLETDEAILDLRRALNLDPDNARLLQLEAQAHQRAGNQTLVGERLAAAARVSDFDPEHALRYAQFLLSEGRPAPAEAALSEASQRHPTNRQVLSALAEVRLRLNDLAGAEAANAQLQRLEQEGDVTSERLNAAILANQGRLDESIGLLERTVSDEEGGERALTDLIAAYVRSGRTDQAETFLDTLIADNGDNINALVLRAELHAQAGQFTQAEARLRDVIAAAPDNQLGYLLTSRLLLSLGDDAAAETVLREGLAQLPQEPRLNLQLAGVKEARSDFDSAIELYQAAFDAAPGSLVTANNLASLLAEFRADDPEALARARQIATRLRESELPHFQDTYGWITFLSGDAEGAVGHLERAAEGLPDNPIVLYHLGRVYAEIGRTDEARARLEQALGLAENFPKAASARDALAALPPSGG